MFSNATDREIVSSLKGRISKVLSGSFKLQPEEKESLEQLFVRIDNIILWDKKLTKTKSATFKKSLRMCRPALEFSKKPYIQKHILPLLNRVLEQEWSA